jgi:hypothetical protein
LAFAITLFSYLLTAILSFPSLNGRIFSIGLVVASPDFAKASSRHAEATGFAMRL